MRPVAGHAHLDGAIAPVYVVGGSGSSDGDGYRVSGSDCPGGDERTSACNGGNGVDGPDGGGYPVAADIEDGAMVNVQLRSHHLGKVGTLLGCQQDGDGRTRGMLVLGPIQRDAVA